MIVLKYRASFLERVKGAPETVIITVGGGLNLAWEFAHSSLYTDGSHDLWYIVWSRLHCTVGDAMILLSVFYLTSLVFRSRYWWKTSEKLPSILFVLQGFGYTIWSEWYNTKIAKTWEYSEAMPTVLEIGVSPLLQWTLLPPIVLFQLKRNLQRRNV